MKNINWKNLFFRSILLCFGGFLIGFAIAMCSVSGFGADPITVFYEGLSQTFLISQGLASNYTAYALILIVLVLDWRQLGVGTLIIPFFTQFGINFGLEVLPLLSGPLAVIVDLSGLVLIALGISLTIYANLGRSSNDAFIFSVSKKTHLKYHQVRWGLDLFFAVSGVLLGGRLTWATALAVLFLGKIISFFNEKLEKVFKLKTS